jgi:hypothetical protein
VNELGGPPPCLMEADFLRPVPASGGRESFDILSRGRAPCASSRSGAWCQIVNETFLRRRGFCVRYTLACGADCAIAAPQARDISYVFKRQMQ